MTQELTDTIDQQIQKYSFIEKSLNLAMHIPMFGTLLIPFGEAIHQNINPIDYFTNDFSAFGIMRAVCGLSLTGIGIMYKKYNDDAEMQEIIKNIYIEPEQQKLVVSGAYEQVRNPCYLSQMMAALGLTIITGSPLAVVSLVTCLGVTELLTRYEEKKNLLIFGNEFQEYIDRTPKWIPKKIQHFFYNLINNKKE